MDKVPETLPRARLPDEVVTSIGHGLGVLEPRRGYRSRPENLQIHALVQKLAMVQSIESVVELGAGSGVLLLLAVHASRCRRAVALERQRVLVERLVRTMNALDQSEVVVLEGDVRVEEDLAAVAESVGGSADLVIANPPWFAAGWGQPSRHPSTHASTHELHGGLEDFLRGACALLASSGRIVLVFDARQLARALAAAATLSLGVEHIDLVARGAESARPDVAFVVFSHQPHAATVVAGSLSDEST